MVRLQVRGAVEELPEGLRTIVVEAGNTQEISRERLLDLCGQWSYIGGGGGSCDASRPNFCSKLKHLKESYLVDRCLNPTKPFPPKR